MIRRTLPSCFAFFLAVSSAHAIVTSDQFGSHRVTPGELSFGLDLDGVVMVGEMPPSGDPLVWGSGCLISDRHVLTAAHLLDDDADGQVDPVLQWFPQSVIFELADGLVAIEYDVTSVQWPDTWPAAQGDLAVITLSEAAPVGVTRYPLYGGQEEVGQESVLAGFGRPGYGALGEADAEESPPVKRAGLNRLDAIRDDFPGVDFLAYDFDSGLEENNALAQIGFDSDLGFGADEVFPAAGDSGGPAFLGGTVAGITTFVASLPDTDVTADTDSSWGEGGFSVRVSGFREFVMTATGGAAVFVPEPISVLICGFGCLALQFGRWKRRG